MSLQEPLEGKPRKYLNKLVSLTELDGFLEAVNRGTLADYFHNLTGFSIASASELGLDSDGRLFGSKINVENKILNVPDLNIRDSKEICLFNCVLLGDLHIGSHEGIHDVSLDNCLVLGTLSISGNDQDPHMKVHIWNSNCTILRINSDEIHELDVGASNIHDCHLVNTRCETLRMTSNKIQFFRLENFEVTRCDFLHRQVDLAQSFPVQPVRGTREAKDIDWNVRATVLLDFTLGSNLQSQSIFETLTFLRNRTFIGGDQRSLSELRYRTALLSQSKTSRAFVRLTRAFESPWRFAMFASVILLGAALIYTTRFCGFVHNANIVLQNGGYQIHSEVSWGLPFFEALYFSCITFTTIGYGDLTPVGLTRFFAASEGLVGIILASSFIVSLVKRYIEK